MLTHYWSTTIWFLYSFKREPQMKNVHLSAKLCVYITEWFLVWAVFYDPGARALPQCLVPKGDIIDKSFC